MQKLDSITKRNRGEDVLKILAQITGMYSVYGSAIPLKKVVDETIASDHRPVLAEVGRK